MYLRCLNLDSKGLKGIDDRLRGIKRVFVRFRETCNFHGKIFAEKGFLAEAICVFYDYVVLLLFYWFYFTF